MKKLTQILIISCFGMAAVGYAQGYNYESNYPSQGNYSGQPQNYQTQPQYRDNQGMNPGQRATYQDQNYKQSNQSSWTNWMSSDDKNQNVPDDVITSNAMQNLMSTPYLSPTAQRIQVATKDGKVTLKGRAANKNEKNLVEYIVKNVPGVKSVSNDLETEK